MFDHQPILQGNLLRVRPLRPEDYDGLLSAASDPMIWEQHPAKNRYKADEFKVYFDESINSGGALLVEKANSNEVVGSTRYHAYSEAESEVEIGWTFLIRNCWGGVYNRELKNLTMAHAFNYVDTVAFLIDKNNVRSQNSVLNIGAAPAGIRHKPNGLEMMLFKISKTSFNL